MKICGECGVELDDSMQTCPLCDTHISDGGQQNENRNVKRISPTVNAEMKHVMQRILWQITMVLLVSGIMATLIINITILGRITWAIYPVTICLMLLAYASLMALWRVKFIFRLLGGWLISALLLLIVSRFTDTQWPLKLAFPIVTCVNIVGIILCVLLTRLKTKGLNALAIVFVSLAALALMIECVLSLYFFGSVVLGWSVIVAACLLPVTAAILFMYFRTRNNSELQKIFHT